MSDNDRPDQQAFRELQALVHHLVEELASFRRRALRAEARLRELDSTVDSDQPLARERVMELERENADLRERLDTAKERSRGILDRVHFLKQQAQSGA
jgi:hypothetical protein